MPDRPDWTDPQLQTLQQQLLSVAFATDVPDAGVLDTVISAVANRRIYIVSWTVAPGANSSQGDEDIRGWIRCAARGTTSVAVIANAAISPEAPLGFANIPAGGAAPPLGEGVKVSTIPEYGIGKTSIVYYMTYYLAAS